MLLLNEGPPPWDFCVLYVMSHAQALHPQERVFEVVGRFAWAPGRLSYPPGPILGSVFLWRCFCRQKPPCRSIHPPPPGKGPGNFPKLVVEFCEVLLLKSIVLSWTP